MDIHPQTVGSERRSRASAHGPPRQPRPYRGSLFAPVPRRLLSDFLGRPACRPSRLAVEWRGERGRRQRREGTAAGEGSKLHRRRPDAGPRRQGARPTPHARQGRAGGGPGCRPDRGTGRGCSGETRRRGWAGRRDPGRSPGQRRSAQGADGRRRGWRGADRGDGEPKPGRQDGGPAADRRASHRRLGRLAPQPRSKRSRCSRWSAGRPADACARPGAPRVRGARGPPWPRTAHGAPCTRAAHRTPCPRAAHRAPCARAAHWAPCARAAHRAPCARAAHRAPRPRAAGGAAGAAHRAPDASASGGAATTERSCGPGTSERAGGGAAPGAAGGPARAASLARARARHHSPRRYDGDAGRPSAPGRRRGRRSRPGRAARAGTVAAAPAAPAGRDAAEQPACGAAGRIAAGRAAAVGGATATEPGSSAAVAAAEATEPTPAWSVLSPTGGAACRAGVPAAVRRAAAAARSGRVPPLRSTPASGPDRVGHAASRRLLCARSAPARARVPVPLRPADAGRTAGGQRPGRHGLSRGRRHLAR
jgi:hypothetical protein